MARVLSRYNDNDDRSDVYFEYMAQVRSAVIAYDVPGLKDLPRPSFEYGAYNNFYTEVVSAVLKLGLQGRRERSSYSVALSQATKARLKKQADVLREALDASDLSEEQKARLRSKLDEFTDELEKERSSIGKMMAAASIVVAALTSVAVMIGKAEEDVIKGPQVLAAVQRISLLVGHEKGVEVEKAPQSVKIAAPQKRIEAPKQPSATASADLDDEIPF